MKHMFINLFLLSLCFLTGCSDVTVNSVSSYDTEIEEEKIVEDNRNSSVAYTKQEFFPNVIFSEHAEDNKNYRHEVTEAVKESDGSSKTSEIEVFIPDSADNSENSTVNETTENEITDVQQNTDNVQNTEKRTLISSEDLVVLPMVPVE